MESDDDYEQFTQQEETPSSSQHQSRKLKRLKKPIKLPKSPLQKTSIESDLLDKCPSPDFIDSGDSSRRESPSSEGFEKDKGSDSLDDLLYGENRPAAKRVLTFADFEEGLEGNGDGSIGGLGVERESSESKRGNTDGIVDENDKKKKRAKSTGDKKEKKKTAKNTDEHAKPKTSKKKETEERKARIAQLADFQRQLRERRYVGFEPVPMVQKPVSSVLEKIRKRKKELSEKVMPLNKIHHNEPLREVMLDSDSEDVPMIETVAKKHKESVSEEKTVQPSPKESLSSPSDKYNEVTNLSSDEHVSPAKILKEESKQTFRAPITDTEDILADYQQGESQDDKSIEEQDTPIEEDLGNAAPSIPEMNLRLDSAPTDDDMSSDEEDLDKENIDPCLQQPNREIPSPGGDPVQQFVDEEAVEEDDSDNEHACFQDEDENLDPEEFKDIIATNYKEKPIDRERRNELHQMWLEKQDEAGTENLLQKLGCGMKQTDSIFGEEEDEDERRNNNEEDEFDDDDEAGEDSIPPNGAPVSTRKIKQMIPQMFDDKDDGFISSDDEETEKMLKKQRLLENAGLQGEAILVPPAEDEASREVFGRIKKLNIASDTKKRPKRTSFFDTLLTSGSSSHSKSSFLRRASNQSVSSTHKPISSSASTVKSFIIFGRDDSNSRSAISASEDSSDVDLNQNENQQKKNGTAKFTSSQARLRTQSAEIPSQTASNTSLLSVLRRSYSLQTTDCTRNSLVDHQAAFAALKSVKKPINIEGRY